MLGVGLGLEVWGGRGREIDAPHGMRDVTEGGAEMSQERFQGAISRGDGLCRQ